MSNFPWYKRFPGDYRRDTAHLTLAQHGAYGLLLDHYYSNAAPLPADLDALRRICSCSEEAERKAVDFVVAQFFELRADGYHNKRADLEIAEAAERHEQRVRGGRKTASKRWGSSATSSRGSSRVGNPDSRYQIPKEEKKNPAAKTAPPPDPRHKPFCDAFCRLYKERYGQNPTFLPKDFGDLKGFLSKNLRVTLEEFERRYCHFRKSTDHIYSPRHGSLSFFVAHFNDFIDGPILERKKPSANGKSFDLLGTAAALGFGKPS